MRFSVILFSGFVQQMLSRMIDSTEFIRLTDAFDIRANVRVCPIASPLAV